MKKLLVNVVGLVVAYVCGEYLGKFIENNSEGMDEESKAVTKLVVCGGFGYALSIVIKHINKRM